MWQPIVRLCIMYQMQAYEICEGKALVAGWTKGTMILYLMTGLTV